MTSRRYLPWARTGAASLLAGSFGPARTSVVLTAAATGGTKPVQVTATLHGPGDVTGIDPRQVIRTDPPGGATDFEPDLLVCLELDEPTLPWLFTPAGAANDQLRPWLVLVVLPAGAASLDRDSGHPSPVLTIAADAGSQLPDLAQSWAWAHVQLTSTANPAAVLGDRAQSTATLARLICPRRLEPSTSYLAALVPATLQGAQAALGGDVTDGPLQPAWTAATGYLQLPVFYSWKFSTGPAGDFESLVSRLRRVHLDAAAVAGRPLDLTELHALTGAGPADATTLLPGALGGDPDGPPAVDPALAASLRALLDLAAPDPARTPGAAELPLSLPIYGRWHAALRSAPAAGGTGWAAQLNLHPAARAVAAVGTRIVQKLQEELMTAAWQQAGQVAAANQLLRQAQLARGGGAAGHARLASMPATTIVAVTSAVHGRVLDTTAPLAKPATVLATVRSSRVPGQLLGASLRRVLRPRGPLGRRGAPRAAELVGAINDGSVHLPGPAVQPTGMVTVDAIASGTKAGADGAPPLCSLTPQRLRSIPVTNPSWSATVKALITHQQQVRPCDPPSEPVRPTLDLAGLKHTLLSALDPRTALPARIAARVDTPPGWAPADPLEPVLAAPQLATSMYREVLRIDPQLVLPAAATLPLNSVSSVSTNPWFIAALMVGANHELCREMLWRGYPTDQRATCLRDFWDRRGRQPAAAALPVHDVDLITNWDPATPLAAHADAGTAQTVVLLRSELLRRFPRTSIYLARAQRSQPDPAAPPHYDLAPVTGVPADAGYPEHYPMFAGDLPPDIAFFGFDVPPGIAVGSDTNTDPGYFLVFQEPLTETRLGLDADRGDGEPFAHWAQLAWTDVTVTRHHIDLPASGGPAPADPRGLHFDGSGTSAQIAAALEQQSFRAAIHVSNLLDPV